MASVSKTPILAGQFVFNVLLETDCSTWLHTVSSRHATFFFEKPQWVRKGSLTAWRLMELEADAQVDSSAIKD